jgi:hypothetical protein
MKYYKERAIEVLLLSNTPLKPLKYYNKRTIGVQLLSKKQAIESIELVEGTRNKPLKY